jgi:hypothetical protein
VPSYLRWQYGIYSSFGMTYEEFWQKDYLLVESFIKKNEMDIERETSSNWELVSYIRGAMLEIATNIYKDPKKPNKPFEFPKKPSSRTMTGRLNEKRNKTIAEEIRLYFEQKLLRKKGKSDDN